MVGQGQEIVTVAGIPGHHLSRMTGAIGLGGVRVQAALKPLARQAERGDRLHKTSLFVKFWKILIYRRARGERRDDI
jgi:hypothetical protein